MARSEAEALPAASLSADIERLYERYAPSVERWVMRLGGPFLDVPDLVHDIFIIAHRRLPHFRGEASHSTWLFRITERVVRKRRRREALRRWVSLQVDDTEALASDRPSPQDDAERQEQVRRLYAALEKLPEKYRTPVILYELEGMAGDEIARLLHTEVGTVWVWLHRGRAKLLKHLGGKPARRRS